MIDAKEALLRVEFPSDGGLPLVNGVRTIIQGLEYSLSDENLPVITIKCPGVVIGETPFP